MKSFSIFLKSNNFRQQCVQMSLHSSLKIIFRIAARPAEKPSNKKKLEPCQIRHPSYDTFAEQTRIVQLLQLSKEREPAATVRLPAAWQSRRCSHSSSSSRRQVSRHYQIKADYNYLYSRVYTSLRRKKKKKRKSCCCLAARSGTGSCAG